MMDTEILDMLEDIGRKSVARLTPAIYLQGETALSRRNEVVQAIRGTILPRRLEFTAADGTSLALEVNNARITDIFNVSSGAVPDFETEPRDALTEKLAKLVSEIATAPGPLELKSLRPDTVLEADDVGITFSEFETACANYDLPIEPHISIVADAEDEPLEIGDSDQAAPLSTARQFFDRASKFALGRILIDNEAAETAETDGLCAPDQTLHTNSSLLADFTRDLAGWQADGESALSQPQLIVMRPSGGQGLGLAVVHDHDLTAAAVHETRKLGAVVNLWKALKSAAE